jgi:hypothetical protein
MLLRSPPRFFSEQAATSTWLNAGTVSHSGEPAPKDVGLAWREALTKAFRGQERTPLRKMCPPQIEAWWAEFRRYAGESLTAVNDGQPSVMAAAYKLCAAADAASIGMGIQPSNDQAGSDDSFLAMAQLFLLQNEERSFCSIVKPDALAVLGKQHTPQRGCTIRSLSHNLALYTPREILARWSGPWRRTSDTPEVVNLLLLPWPMQVHADDFSVSRDEDGHPETPLVGAHRYFDYAPRRTMTPKDTASAVKRALRCARDHAD